MPSPLADYLFLASLFVPTTGILAGVIYLFIPRRAASVPRGHHVEAKAH